MSAETNLQVAAPEGAAPSRWPRAAARRLAPLGVPAFYTLVALLFSWPLPLQLGSHVPYLGDSVIFLWDIWYFRQAIESWTNPFHTTLLYHPYGVSTAFTTLVPLESALMAPLQWLGGGPVLAYNLLMLLSSILGAWAMWALALRLTGSRPAALVAGLVYGWSPYHSTHALGGHLNLASHQWLPLYALALLRTIDALWPGGWAAELDDGEPRDAVAPPPARPWRWAALTGLAAAAVALTEWTYAAFLVLWTILYLAYRGWPLARAGAWRPLLRAAGPLAAAAALALLLTAPLLGAMIRDLRDADYLVRDPAESLDFSADLAAYLAPNERHPLVWRQFDALNDRLGTNPAERIVTLGYTVPLLCLAALIAGRRRRAVRFWGWSAAVFAILSLGPVLHLLGRTSWTTWDTGVLLPYAILYKLPGFAVMRAPARFAVLVSLSAAVLAAYGLVALRARWPRVRHAGRALALAAAVLILAEYWTTSELVAPGSSAVAETMRRDPVPGAVLNVPTIPAIEYLWYQAQHERPLVGGFLSRQPPDRFAAENPVMRYLDPATPADADAAVRDGAGVRSLREAGIRFVVVYWWVAAPDEIPELERKLATLFGGADGVELVPMPGEQADLYIIAPPPGR